MQTIYVILAAFAVTAAAQKTQKCYDGPLDMHGHNVTKDQMVEMASGLFFDGAGKVIATHPGFKKFMQSRGQCQVHGCIDKMVPAAVSTVYGKCGKEFMSDKCGKLVVESLTGAFMACFPGSPRGEVHELVGNIIHSFGEGAPKNNSGLFAANPKCPESAESFDKDGFAKAFGMALGSLAKKHPEVMKFFAEDALDCQQSCLENTIVLATATLHQTKNEDKEQIIQALTGAARVCFPGQSRQELKALMSATVATFDDRLYDTNMQVETTSSLPMLGAAALLSLVIFFAGAAVGKRVWPSRAGRSDLQLLPSNELENDDLECEE